MARTDRADYWLLTAIAASPFPTESVLRTDAKAYYGVDYNPRHHIEYGLRQLRRLGFAREERATPEAPRMWTLTEQGTTELNRIRQRIERSWTQVQAEI